jgi:hypothetical protein
MWNASSLCWHEQGTFDGFSLTGVTKSKLTVEPTQHIRMRHRHMQNAPPSMIDGGAF